MGRPFQGIIDDRRRTVVHFLKEGLSPREIARKIKTRLRVVKRDIEAIEADREVWDLVYQTGYDYSAIKEAIKLEEEKRLAETERWNALGASVIALRDNLDEVFDNLGKPQVSQRPVSRGPKGARERIARRRAVVKELRYRGIKQKEIARILNTPLRTIQGDYASLNNGWYAQLKAQEKMIRERLSVFTDAEVVEVFLGSPERIKELWEKPWDDSVRFDLIWVKKKRRAR